MGTLRMGFRILYAIVHRAAVIGVDREVLKI